MLLLLLFLLLCIQEGNKLPRANAKDLLGYQVSIEVLALELPRTLTYISFLMFDSIEEGCPSAGADLQVALHVKT